MKTRPQPASVSPASISGLQELTALLQQGGRATVDQVAAALLARDRAQLDYYREITRQMPGAVLRRRGVVSFEAGAYSLPGMEELTTAEQEGVLVPLVHSRPGGVKTTVGEYNFGNYSNPKVDELLDKGRVELDMAKRYAIFNEAMSVMDAEVAFIPLVYRHVTWAMRKNIKAKLRPNDILDLRFVNVD